MRLRKNRKEKKDKHTSKTTERKLIKEIYRNYFSKKEREREIGEISF